MHSLPPFAAVQKYRNRRSLASIEPDFHWFSDIGSVVQATFRGSVAQRGSRATGTIAWHRGLGTGSIVIVTRQVTAAIDRQKQPHHDSHATDNPDQAQQANILHLQHAGCGKQ